MRVKKLDYMKIAVLPAVCGFCCSERAIKMRSDGMDGDAGLPACDACAGGSKEPCKPEYVFPVAHAVFVGENVKNIKKRLTTIVVHRWYPQYVVLICTDIALPAIVRDERGILKDDDIRQEILVRGMCNPDGCYFLELIAVIDGVEHWTYGT